MSTTEAHAVTIAELLLPEFDEEMANTRKVLERVPEDKFEWRSTPKANTIGWVTRHIAEIPEWMALTLNLPSFDVNPPGGKKYQASTETSLAKILATFDKSVVEARAALVKTNDAQFNEPWSLLSEGKPIFTLPRYKVVRSFVINHAIHHRAYLLSYLRAIGVAVPGMYGPSGDEAAG
jgi:uncharacterized damage-inducible protein DinB